MDSYNKIIADLIRRFGCEISVTKGESLTALCAFIQPLRYKNKLYLDGTSLTQGLYDGSHYLMIAPSNLKLEQPCEDYVIKCDAMDKYFTVKKCEIYYLSSRPLYVWAILGEYIEQEAESNEV